MDILILLISILVFLLVLSQQKQIRCISHKLDKLSRVDNVVIANLTSKLKVSGDKLDDAIVDAKKDAP